MVLLYNVTVPCSNASCSDGVSFVANRARSCGMHHLRITLNGMDIAGSPFQFSVQTPCENVDPLSVHPDQLKDIENCKDNNLGTNPACPKLHPQYILNGIPKSEYGKWTPPSAPSTEGVFQGLNSREGQGENDKQKGMQLPWIESILVQYAHVSACFVFFCPNTVEAKIDSLMGTC